MQKTSTYSACVLNDKPVSECAMRLDAEIRRQGNREHEYDAMSGGEGRGLRLTMT